MSDNGRALYDTPGEDITGSAWRLLEAGRDSARDALHTPVLATVGQFGPSQRTVVLRHVDPQRRILACHTDARSLKIHEAGHDARTSWLFYDRERKLQLRLSGRSSIHVDDELAERRWAETNDRGRACYNSSRAPGQDVTSPLPAPVLIADPESEAASRARFAVIATRVDFLDWLVLSNRGHRRAQFLWQDGRWFGGWVAP